DAGEERLFIEQFGAADIDDEAALPHATEPLGGEDTVGFAGQRGVEGDDVHRLDHAVEIVPIGGAERHFYRQRSAVAGEVVDAEAESAGAKGDGGDDAADADNAECLAAEAGAEHGGGRPAGPLAV